MGWMDKLLVGLLFDLFLRAFCYETLFLRGQGHGSQALSFAVSKS